LSTSSRSEQASTEVEPGFAPRAEKRGFRRTLAAYVALTKPRVLELLLVSTVPVMFLAAEGLPNLWLVLATSTRG
jgi:protoheme IX farnesyltransferase